MTKGDYEKMAEYHRGYVDGAGSLDAERTAVVSRLRDLDLSKYGYAYPRMSAILCAIDGSDNNDEAPDVNWSALHAMNVRNLLIRLLGGAYLRQTPGFGSGDADVDAQRFEKLLEQRDDAREAVLKACEECEKLEADKDALIDLLRDAREEFRIRRELIALADKSLEQKDRQIEVLEAKCANAKRLIDGYEHILGIAAAKGAPVDSEHMTVRAGTDKRAKISTALGWLQGFRWALEQLDIPHKIAKAYEDAVHELASLLLGGDEQ